MGNLDCTFKVDYKTMIKSWDDVIPVIRALLNKVTDKHVQTYFEMNRNDIPEDIHCRTVKEAKAVLDDIQNIQEADWLATSLRHIKGMCAVVKSWDTMPEAEIDNEILQKLGWSDFKILQWHVAAMETFPRILTAIMFNAADKDGNGTLSFEEYFAHRAKSGAVPQELKAKLRKEFTAIDKDGNGELDFEEVVEFFVGDPTKIEIIQQKVDKNQETLEFEKNSMKKQMKKAMLLKIE